MPFRDERQAAYDKIAALEQRLRERPEPADNVDQLELLALLRRERQLAETALAEERAARQADRQSAQEEIARARAAESSLHHLIAAKEQQHKLLQDAIGERNNTIQSTLNANIKALEDTLKSTQKNIDHIKRQAQAELESFASLSRARALRSYQSQRDELQLRIKQHEAKLSIPAPPPPVDPIEAQMQREAQQAIQRVDEDILSAMRQSEEHLTRMCAILSQPPKD